MNEVLLWLAGVAMTFAIAANAFPSTSDTAADVCRPYQGTTIDSDGTIIIRGTAC